MSSAGTSSPPNDLYSCVVRRGRDLLVEVDCLGVLGDAEDSCPLALSLIESFKKLVPCGRVTDDGVVDNRHPTSSILNELGAELSLGPHPLA